MDQSSQSPITDSLALQIQIAQDDNGDLARGLCMQFRQAQLSAQTLIKSAETVAERQMIATFQAAFPEVANVFEKLWETSHKRDLLLDSRAAVAWPTDADESHQALARYLRCACLIADQHAWLEQSSILAKAVNLTPVHAQDFEVARAISRAVGGDSNDVYEILSNQHSDESTQLMIASALMLIGDDEWRPVVERLMAYSTDPQIREAGLSLLNSTPQWNQ